MNANSKPGLGGAISRDLKRHGSVYLMALPGLGFLFCFNYLPMMGVIIAFKDFNFRDGIIGSRWMKPIFYNFKYLFSSSKTLTATVNTIYLNFLFMLFGTAIAVAIALALNELKNKYFRSTVQSMTFLPYFLSWVVVSVFAYAFLSNNSGIINSFLRSVDIKTVDWYSTPSVWPAIMTIIYVWKNGGYHAIMYIAVLAGVDPSLYEAAQIDGANRWRQTLHISIPMLMPTIIVLNLLAIGRIMNADFGFFYGIVGDNSIIYPTVDVLDTFVYRSLKQIGDIGMSSAAGLYQSMIAFILVLISNKCANKYFDGAGLF